jgi:hypothetical protein
MKYLRKFNENKNISDAIEEVAYSFMDIFDDFNISFIDDIRDFPENIWDVSNNAIYYSAPYWAYRKVDSDFKNSIIIELNAGTSGKTWDEFNKIAIRIKELYDIIKKRTGFNIKASVVNGGVIRSESGKNVIRIKIVLDSI